MSLDTLKSFNTFPLKLQIEYRLLISTTRDVIFAPKFYWLNGENVFFKYRDHGNTENSDFSF